MGGEPRLLLVLGDGPPHPDRQCQGPDEPFLEGWTVLSGLAAVTTASASRARLLRATEIQPAGEIAAGVDQISRGRLTFGIGAGWFETEYRQYGWAFPPRPAVRIRQMEEAVRLILGMWTTDHLPGQVLSGRGRHPGTQADPEAASAGDRRRPGRPGVARVARLADACNVGGTPDMVRHKYDVLRRHARRRGGTTTRSSAPTSSASSSRRGGLAAKRQKLAVPDNYYGVAGTVSQITDLIGRYRDAGVQLPDQQRLPERRRNAGIAGRRRDAEGRELVRLFVLPVIRGRIRRKPQDDLSAEEIMTI